MPIDLSIISTILTGGLAVLTFFIGRQTAANNSGQKWGELMTDVRYIKESMSEIKSNLNAEVQALRAEIALERKDRGDSVRRVHDKIEEHIVECHNGGKKGD